MPKQRQDKSFLVLFFKKELLFLGACCVAHGARATPVAVSCAWARASLPHQNTAAAYLTLSSTAGDTLTGVDAPEAGMVMLHQTTTRNGVSEMNDLDSLALPPGRQVALAPGGTHLMLMDMKHALKAGGALHLTLHFTKAGAVAATLPVLPATATVPCS